MEFKMDEASIDSALKIIKENKKTEPFDLLMELEARMKEFESEFLLQEDMGSLSLIPSVPVSEIGWSTTRTVEGEEVPTEQRAQLQQYLGNIKGDDLQAKLKSLSDFYSNPAQAIGATTGGKTKAETIAQTISILTFFKTLTMIITHFNAASAGFSFESFLAVLLGGKQVPTNSDTIADLTAADGTPISLKLYKEGQLEVGGSFTDLVNDIVGTEQMQYISVTKKLSGEDFDQNGTLDFYRFNFNLDNIFNIISRSSKRSKNNILLPKPFLDSKGQQVEGLPEKKLGDPSPEQLESSFIEIFTQMYEENREVIESEVDPEKFNLETFLDRLNYAKSEDLVAREATGKNKGKFYTAPLIRLVKQFLINTDVNQNIVKASALYRGTLQANEILRKKFAKDEREEARQQELNEIYFWGDSEPARWEASRAFYDEASPDLKKKCLLVSYGYVNTGHFNMTQRMVENIVDMASPTPGELFPGNQNKVLIGSIEIGADKVRDMVEEARKVINESVFEIFKNLKSLTQNIGSYFAGGLSDDSLATNALENAGSIEEKTSEISGVKPRSSGPAASTGGAGADSRRRRRAAGPAVANPMSRGIRRE